ncbi:MAG: hypothetical protein H0W33_06380 [Gammaproteobacteria bacterium]|nr:hypothetical protein [Gammaproteobacteria bacterium]
MHQTGSDFSCTILFERFSGTSFIRCYGRCLAGFMTILAANPGRKQLNHSPGYGVSRFRPTFMASIALKLGIWCNVRVDDAG